jgi:voltage-gated potassium channel
METVSRGGREALRERVREIIFEAGSVAAVMLESIVDVKTEYDDWLRQAEWVITALFTLEYILRLWCVEAPSRYARSFFGIVDLLAILPTYMSLLLPGSQSLLVIRALRLLRIFRVFKLAHYLGQANVLATALRSSGPKVIVFMGTVLILIVITGSAMYLVEGPEHGFTSIPRSMYWAIVTMTTVGYGDLAPETPLGQVLAALVMLMGYSIIAVPTGIVSAELVQAGPAHVPPVPARGTRPLRTTARTVARLSFRSGSRAKPTWRASRRAGRGR